MPCIRARIAHGDYIKNVFWNWNVRLFIKPRRLVAPFLITAINVNRARDQRSRLYTVICERVPGQTPHARFVRESIILIIRMGRFTVQIGYHCMPDITARRVQQAVCFFGAEARNEAAPGIKAGPAK